MTMRFAQAPHAAPPLNRGDAVLSLDRTLHAAVGRWTGGLSPTPLALAGLDWWLHLAGSPAKQVELAALALREAERLAAGRPDCPAAETDPRFRDPAWRAWPHPALADAFLAQQRWWEAATTGIRGLDPHHADVVRFTVRQVSDTTYPANGIFTNPVVLWHTARRGGAEPLRGAANWVEDLRRVAPGAPAEHPDHRVGETVAATPGRVVMRDHLGAHPPRPDPRPRPLEAHAGRADLEHEARHPRSLPHNSLVAWLRDRGFAVHALSWHNPGSQDADPAMQDYFDLGPRAALDHLSAQGAERVHLAGYCLGGTLAAITAAAMARDGVGRLAALTRLAAQADFEEAGEHTLYVDESEIAFLEDVMAAQGFLRADQMAGAFRLLRSGDLIWSRVIRHYLLGERTPMNDLMAWNADATRMPARMHGEYLRGLFLENRLARGEWRVDGRPVALTDIRAPIFCLATERDHVSP